MATTDFSNERIKQKSAFLLINVQFFLAKPRNYSGFRQITEKTFCHSREGGNLLPAKTWIPAFAGMTAE